MLQMVQNILLTAVTVVLALVVLTTFLRVIRPPDPQAAGNSDQLAGDVTTIAPGTGPGPAATTDPATAAPDAAGSPDTTAVPGDQPEARCSEPSPPEGSGTLLRVFYTCGTGQVPDVSGFVYRRVPTTELVLTATMEEMVKGPDAEERDLGFTSTFSDATSDALSGLSLDAGTAVIDLTGIDGVTDLSRPTAANALLAELNATVFQFDTIEAVEYRLDGSCDDFWAQLGAECRTITRGEWNRQLAEWQASG